MPLNGKQKEENTNIQLGDLIFDITIAIIVFVVSFYLIYLGTIRSNLFVKIIYILLGILIFSIGLNKLTNHIYKKAKRYVEFLSSFSFMSCGVTIFIFSMGLLTIDFDNILLILMIVSLVGIIYGEYSLIKIRQNWKKYENI